LLSNSPSLVVAIRWRLSLQQDESSLGGLAEGNPATKIMFRCLGYDVIEYHLGKPSLPRAGGGQPSAFFPFRLGVCPRRPTS